MPSNILADTELSRRDRGVRALFWRSYTKPFTPFRVTTSDGIPLRGIHLHNDFETLLIYCHGFSSGKNFLNIPHLAEMLSSELDVIVFDFRGHGESGGETTFGAKELFDLDAVMEYAKRFGYRRIILMGSSMGGAISIRYAADSPDVDAVITMGAFAHKRFSMMAMAGLGVLKWSFSRRVMGSAWLTRIERAQPAYEPRDFVARISPRPLLLLHGEHDPLIPLSHARDLFARAREPKTLHIIRRGGHDLENINQPTIILIMNWLKKNVSPPNSK